MAEFPSKGVSLWLETMRSKLFSPLDNDVKVDIAVIGGGIAGLTAAYLLKRSGKTVAVFEKNRIASGVSGFTTGKVTSQHGRTYTAILKQFGRKVAKDYAEANQAAISRINEIIDYEKISCGWVRQDSYVFTEKKQNVAELKQEAIDAGALGLPSEFMKETPLPFHVKGAVCFRNQASLHIGDYLQGLAGAIHGGGSAIYEQSKAAKLHDGEIPEFTANGHKIIANDVVVCTNVPSPIPSHGLYAFLEYPTRSYIVAGVIEEDIKGMYISADSPTRSILCTETMGEKWMLIGGDGHIVGKSGKASHHYSKLIDYARAKFGTKNFPFQWSTWDYIGYDNLPLIGKMHPWSSHIYTATAFRKWGLTNATVAAMIFSDILSGKQNKWEHTFRSNRLSAFKSMPKGLARGFFN